MEPLIIWVIGAALLLLFFAAVVYFAFWIAGKMGLAEPMGLIVRAAIGIVSLLVLFWLAIEHGPPPGIGK